MEIKGIKYMGPFLDGSGYSEASRQYVVALHKLGIPLTLQNISFEAARPELGEAGNVIHSLFNKKIDYNIKIMQLTPEHYPLYKEPNVYNIGYSFWETSGICKQWVDFFNEDVQLCLVPCEWNKEVYYNSGVRTPIKKIHQGIDYSEYENIEEFKIAGLPDDAYIFYSIFQWTERKHPLGLIKSYWNAFQNKENVALVLKTYKSSFAESEREAIRSMILQLKHMTPMDYYPPIYLILDMLSKKEILGLHKRGDAFVLFHRGEGWGLPHFEAGATGNCVITTGMSGNMEFTTPDNSYLTNYTWTPVTRMPWCPWYKGTQWWAEPDLKQGMELMQHVYKNQDEAKQKGLLLQNHIKQNFSWEKVAKDMINCIKEI